MDEQAANASLRDAMACYPTGVTIVAACDDAGEPFGMTVNSFTSVSLHPPLILVCIGHTSSSHDRLVAGGGFVVNVLSEEQQEVAARFASEPSEGRFDDVEWKADPAGHPLLAGAAAWLSCSLHEVVRGGDHSIVLGRVESTGVTDRPALVFHRGRMSSAR